MADKNLNVKIINRHGKSTEWISSNPQLDVGEIGIEIDTGKIKIGKAGENGILLHWNDLDYSSQGPEGPIGPPGITTLKVGEVTSSQNHMQPSVIIDPLIENPETHEHEQIINFDFPVPFEILTADEYTQLATTGTLKQNVMYYIKNVNNSGNFSISIDASKIKYSSSETLLQHQNTYESNLNQNFNSFKSSVNSTNTNFQTNLTNSNDQFKTNLTKSNSEFQKTLTNTNTQFQTELTDTNTKFQTDLTTGYETFKTETTESINTQLDVAKAELQSAQSTFETKINKDFTNYKNTIDPRITNLETILGSLTTEDCLLLKDLIKMLQVTFVDVNNNGNKVILDAHITANSYDTKA